MADIVDIQTLVDGERNLVVKLVGFLDTDNASGTLIDLADVSPLNASGLNPILPTSVAISKVTFTIEDGLAVNLYWEADENTPIWRFVGRGKVDGKKFGNLQNNAAAGKTGNILYDTDGAPLPGDLAASFTILVECIKQLN